MALSFEESKKKLMQQAATPMMLSLRHEPIAAYSNDSWTRHTGYRWFEDYYDDKISHINEIKDIAVHESQVNISQEVNSQFIPFEMNRYYDNIDLVDMVISVHYTTSDKYHGSSQAVNVEYNDEKIRFSWLVDENATHISGAMQFEVHADGAIYDSEGNSYGYRWKTKSTDKFNILESLCEGQDHESVVVTDDWVVDIVTAVAESVGGKIADAQIGAQVVAAENAANRAEASATNAQNAVQAELGHYYTKTEIDNKIQNVDLTGYATEQYVQDEIAKVDVSDQLPKNLSDLEEDETHRVVTDAEKQTWNAKSDFSGNYSDLIGAPTKVSDFENDSGYLTDHQDLSAYALKSDVPNIDGLATEKYVDDAVAAVDVSEQLQDYAKSADVYTKDEVDTAISNVEVDLSGYYTKSEVDVKTAPIESNTSNISSLSSTVIELQGKVNGIDTSPRKTYDVAYNDAEDPDVGENVFVFYEIENEGLENQSKEPKAKFTIVGGGGGSSSSSSLKIEYITKTPIVATINDKVIIKYNFTGTDSSGDTVMDGDATWKVAGRVVATNTAVAGENSFDITDFLALGTQKVNLSITDDAGSLVTKTWTVQKVDVRLESTFSDTYTYNGNVAFNYTPYGAIEKEIHFVLDGTELGTITTSTSGIPMSYTIPEQTHGAHLLEVYITAEINGKTIGLEEIIDEESGDVVGYNHTIRVLKDIIWYDSASTIPVIGCATPTINVMQYNTVNIKYTVFDPNTESPEVIWYIDDVAMPAEKLAEKDDDGYYTYSYKANSDGTFVFKITCGEAEPKTIILNVEKLNLEISPVTAGLAFDFNPVGYSNSSVNRLWSYNDVAMTVSENFDWVNGGYHADENGDWYFCVKAGTNAIINYNLFADDPKKDGKEFKVVFRTKNIRKRDTSFLTCLDDGIGLDMKVENATVYDSGGLTKTHYCEDEIIEYEFNINKDRDMMIVMSYEDGTPNMPYEYKSTSSFKQTSAQPITIGSPDCDILIYRMKAYSISLTDTDIKNNFIADARNADEMIARYNRNKIYNDNGTLISTSANGDFSVDALMKAAPGLRYIFLEVPQFTNDKDNKIDGCTVHFRYPAGKRAQDNWTCTGVRHRGQGTSSNLYGYAGRNIDLCMDRDESLFTWTDEEGNTVESSTITLTDTSVPTDYLNIKVNIASSENANNAEMARRFNEYQPFLRYARKKDSKVKDTMEFYNCVVFVRETSEDASTPHREFNDTNWHFYAIGNVGDSKKTDDTRVNSKRDPKEHVIEITDADKPLSAFPTGKDGNAVCPINEWQNGNTAYDILHSTEYVYDEEGAFESFGGETYEFRYEMKNITEEQREANINAWRELYKFIVTSTDEEFHDNLKKYFVVDSALYYYLFTERYTMVDNRAKNSFWHYGKVYISNEEALTLGETEASYYIIDDEQASFANGYRYDLTFGYDFDTALGIDNTGDYVFSYGKEDTDYYVDGDPTSDYVFRVANSVFFCRLRDLFPSEMEAMYKNREEKNAWDSGSLIKQWDNSQLLFPEELWRLDYERKYYRTYLGLSIDNSIAKGVDKTFLIGKFFGRKKYARRAFEINQEMYFATKYFGNKALSDVFWIRGNVPIGSDIKPNYSLTLVPYSDMYLCVQYTSTGKPQHSTINGKPTRIKAGQTYFFENNSDRMDFIYVYAASYIQEVGDLSRCYVGDNNFSSATRLQKLVIGSTDDGYENTFMNTVLVENNPLLEYLDLRNISGINTVIDVTRCSNLKELYAEGTNATGASFANGGLLETAHLPSVTSLSLQNLNYIKDFAVDSYENLQTLIVENCQAINTYQMVNSAPKLKILRLVGMDWNRDYQIVDDSILNRLLLVGGRDELGHETDVSVLAGKFHSSIMRLKNLETYMATRTWKDLEFSWDTPIEQVAITFVNADDDHSVLEVQYVDKGEYAIDPTQREENKLYPVIDSTVSHNFEYSKWVVLSSGADFDFTKKVLSDITLIATYTATIRTYTVKYMSRTNVLQETQAEYGTIVSYEGDIPTYTAEETIAYKYYLFDAWDQGGYVNGDKTINAVYDSCTYTDGYFSGKKLADMRPVEIYMMTKLAALRVIDLKSYIGPKDAITISLGNDVSYADIEEQVLIGEKTVFNGSNYVDTGIQLLSEDRDFVLAIDFKMHSGNSNNAVLAQCFSGYDASGFKLMYNSGVRLAWGGASDSPCSVNNREMLVIRHIKGEYGLHVYVSDVNGTSLNYVELSGSRTMTHNVSLIFGCEKLEDGTYQKYATGTIYWSKVWYADLGDTICRQLACWPHEEFKFEACLETDGSLKRYYLSDGSRNFSSVTFIAANALSKPMKLDTSGSNSGGWATYDLNAYLNNRLYPAFSSKWKQLMKQVQVRSSIGNSSTDTSISDCHIFIPAIAELYQTATSEPYPSEGTLISHMTTPASRICYTFDGDAVSYWTRSPTMGYGAYVYRIDANGNPQQITNVSGADVYTRIMISI